MSATGNPVDLSNGAGAAPSSLYLRDWDVNLTGASGSVNPSALHIVWSTTQSDVETPNSCRLRLYNCSQETINKLMSKEYTNVEVSAGYQNGPYGTVFKGSIKQTRNGKENQTDRYVDILAADGDEAYNFGVVNKTLAAGWTVKQQIDAIAQGMGVDVGYVSDGLATGNPQQSIRGKAMYGLAKDYARQLAIGNNARWSIQNGKLVFILNSDYIQAEPIILSPATGLIGIPEQTQSGIKCKALINPKLIIGQPIKIDSTLINTAQFNVFYGDLASNPNNLFPPISSTGLYRIVVSEMQGDTRGQDWYVELTCFAIASDVAPGSAVNPWP